MRSPLIYLVLCVALFPSKTFAQTITNYFEISKQVSLCFQIFNQGVLEPYVYDADIQLCDSALERVDDLVNQNFSKDDRVKLGNDSSAWAFTVLMEFNKEHDHADWQNEIKRCRKLCDSVDTYIRESGVIPSIE